jgi:hypothetical protein
MGVCCFESPAGDDVVCPDGMEPRGLCGEPGRQTGSNYLTALQVIEEATG